MDVHDMNDPAYKKVDTDVTLRLFMYRRCTR